VISASAPLAKLGPTMAARAIGKGVLVLGDVKLPRWAGALPHVVGAVWRFRKRTGGVTRSVIFAFMAR
jgi:hypothetical protein